VEAEPARAPAAPGQLQLEIDVEAQLDAVDHRSDGRRQHVDMPLRPIAAHVKPAFHLPPARHQAHDPVAGQVHVVYRDVRHLGAGDGDVDVDVVERLGHVRYSAAHVDGDARRLDEYPARAVAPHGDVLDGGGHIDMATGLPLAEPGRET